MYGINIDPANPNGRPTVTTMQQLGATLARYEYNAHVNNAAQFYRQQVQQYANAGVRSLVIIDYNTITTAKPAFDAADSVWDGYIKQLAAAAGEVAKSLAPFNAAFEIWNEPDLGAAEGSYDPRVRPTVYAKLLEQCYEAIKHVSGAAQVIVGGLESGNVGWLQQVMGQLSFKPFDGVGVHPYTKRPSRDWPPASADDTGYIGDLLAAYQKATGKQIWITEYGLGKVNRALGSADLKQQQAEFVTRFYQDIQQHQHEVVQACWFCYSDNMVSPFGLLDHAQKPTPGYTAYAAVAGGKPSPSPAPPTPTPPSPPQGNALFGLHASADPSLAAGELDVFQTTNPGVVKVLSLLDPNDVSGLLRACPNAQTWIVRAFLSFGGRHVTPDQFVQWTAGDVKRTVDLLHGKTVWIELHNEPNLTLEGLSAAWSNGREFATWFEAVLSQYRTRFPSAKFLYPGLSPGSTVANVREDSTTFLRESIVAVKSADGFGTHIYWANDYPLVRAVGVLDGYITTLRQNGVGDKPIFVTEASNDKGGTSPQQKGKEYVQFWQQLRRWPTLQGVTYYVASASSGFDEEVWVRGGKSIGIAEAVANR